jgi:hypothetical protein
MRVSKEGLQAQVAQLNRLYGFGEGPRRSATGKMVGKGFILYGAYGKHQVQYLNYSKGSGGDNVTRLHTKTELSDIMYAMMKAIFVKRGSSNYPKR